MAYSELIKNFEKVRSYMRDFYVYGFKGRDEFDSKSVRIYDDEYRRVKPGWKAISIRIMMRTAKRFSSPLTVGRSPTIRCILPSKPRVLPIGISCCISAFWIFWRTARPLYRNAWNGSPPSIWNPSKRSFRMKEPYGTS